MISNLFGNPVSSIIENAFSSNIDEQSKTLLSSIIDISFILKSNEIYIPNPDFITNIPLNNIEQMSLKQILLTTHYSVQTQKLGLPPMSNDEYIQITNKLNIPNNINYSELIKNPYQVWNILTTKTTNQQEQTIIYTIALNILSELTNDNKIINQISNNQFNDMSLLDYYLLQMIYFSMISSANDELKNKIKQAINNINTNGSVNRDDMPYIPIIVTNMVAQRYKTAAIEQNKLTKINLQSLQQNVNTTNQ